MPGVQAHCAALRLALFLQPITSGKRITFYRDIPVRVLQDSLAGSGIAGAVTPFQILFAGLERNREIASAPRWAAVLPGSL
jgi:hypothetical protein